MALVISIETTRYSEFFRHVLKEYSDGVSIEVGNNLYSSSDIPRLLEEWCTNAQICRTRNFKLVRGGLELFSFHDHPRELIAAMSELSFVEKLYAEKVLRFRVLKQSGKDLSKLFVWLRRWFAN
jgi:hypothetical protein